MVLSSILRLVPNTFWSCALPLGSAAVCGVVVVRGLPSITWSICRDTGRLECWIPCDSRCVANLPFRQLGAFNFSGVCTQSAYYIKFVMFFGTLGISSSDQVAIPGV